MSLAIAEGILLKMYLETGLSPAAIRSKNRCQHYSRARHIVAYALRKRTAWSYPQIAKYIGRKDHTTALHGFKNIASLINSDVFLSEFVGRILTCDPILPLTLNERIKAAKPGRVFLRPSRTYSGKVRKIRRKFLSEIDKKPISHEDAINLKITDGSANLLAAMQAAMAAPSPENRKAA